jgi:hypothetical protein
VFSDESRVYETMSRTGVKKDGNIGDSIGRKRNEWTERMRIGKSGRVET